MALKGVEEMGKHGNLKGIVSRIKKKPEIICFGYMLIFEMYLLIKLMIKPDDNIAIFSIFINVFLGCMIFSIFAGIKISRYIENLSDSTKQYYRKKAIKGFIFMISVFIGIIGYSYLTGSNITINDIQIAYILKKNQFIFGMVIGVFSYINSETYYKMFYRW